MLGHSLLHLADNFHGLIMGPLPDISPENEPGRPSRQRSIDAIQQQIVVHECAARHDDERSPR